MINDKMDCDVFLWRFVTFNEINFMRSGKPLVGMRLCFLSNSMSFHFDENGIKTYFLCIQLFY